RKLPGVRRSNGGRRGKLPWALRTGNERKPRPARNESDMAAMFRFEASKFRLAEYKKSALFAHGTANRNPGKGGRDHHSGHAVRTELHAIVVHGHRQSDRDRPRRG